MPCAATPRGLTDAKFPWTDSIQNNPCGAPTLAAVGGVDVSAQNLCALHYAQKYGSLPQPAVADPTTVLLLHGESLSDEKGHPLTANGGMGVSSAQSKFGGSSLLFDGVDDNITTPDSPDWDLGGGDFTIDLWVRLAATPAGAQAPLSQGTGSQIGWLVQINPASLRFYYTVDGSTLINRLQPWSPVGLTWYHLAIVRQGDLIYHFVNGVSLGAPLTMAGIVIWNSTAPLTIGSYPAQFINGNLDEVRISKVARWTSAFTPPSAPYS